MKNPFLFVCFSELTPGTLREGAKSSWDVKREAHAVTRADTTPPNPVAAEARLLEEVGRTPTRRQGCATGGSDWSKRVNYNT